MLLEFLTEQFHSVLCFPDLGSRNSECFYAFRISDGTIPSDFMLSEFLMAQFQVFLCFQNF